MVFANYRTDSTSQNPAIYLGSPEAEAEALATSQISLSDVYEDCHCLFDELSHEKYIIVGRKGSGKSAFAEYVSLLSESDPNLFCKFIRHGDANLERIVQIGKDNGHDIGNENLFRWLIYTHILKLFSENQSLSSNKNYDLLLKFLRKNSGYIDIKENQIKELIKKQGFDISLEYFKRFFTAKHNRQVEIKEEKAPFYKLLPHLEEVLRSTLSSPEQRENGNSYILFFDDLDIGFHSSDESSVTSLINLLRVAKYINNDIFGKLGLKSKIIVLIRDDIAKLISSRAADTAKIFSAYSTRLNWVPTVVRSEETSWNLRKFINKRISVSFARKNIHYDKSDPWLSLVDESLHRSSSFRHILNFTLYRPRDLILFFQPLQNGNFRVPLTKDDVYNLVGQYSENLALEIKNELSSFYDSIQIETIFNTLSAINKIENCPYEQAVAIVAEHTSSISPESLLIDLFNRSIIGNRKITNRQVIFKCREPMNAAEIYKLRQEDNIIIQNGFKVYLTNKYT